MLAPAGLAVLVGPQREKAVRREIVEVLSPFRRTDGTLRLHNEFRFLIASP